MVSAGHAAKQTPLTCFHMQLPNTIGNEVRQSKRGRIMGIEFMVKLKQSDNRVLVDRALRDCSFFDAYDSTYDVYNFRFQRSDQSMPDVSVTVQEKGLYICFYGGEKRIFEKFKEYIRAMVVDRLGQSFELDEL
jgi:hypothetical protein